MDAMHCKCSVHAGVLALPVSRKLESEAAGVLVCIDGRTPSASTTIQILVSAGLARHIEQRDNYTYQQDCDVVSAGIWNEFA